MCKEDYGWVRGLYIIGECSVSRLLNSMKPAGLERSLWSAGGQHLMFSFMIQLIHYF